MKVVSANGSLLAKQIAQALKLESLSAEVGDFADTETFIKDEGFCGAVSGEEILLVHQFSFGEEVLSINDQFMKLFLLVHAVKTCGASRVTLILPYLAYARQCKSFSGQNIGPFSAIGAMCKAVGVDKVIACDVHELECIEQFFVPLKNVPLDRVWKNVLCELGDISDNLLFVSPDRGGIERVKKVAGDRECAFIEKERVGEDKSRSLRLLGDVFGKDIVLIDDIVDTGTTVLHAIELLKNSGAKKIFGCFSHAVLSGDASEKLENSALEKIWITDSVMITQSALGEKFSVIPLVSRLLKEI